MTIHDERAEPAHDLAARGAELEAAQKELADLSYAISHDLRAPLRAVLGFSKILESQFAGAMPGEAQRLLGLVTSAAAQLECQIDALLRYSRLNRQPLVVQRVDVDDMVRRVVDDLKREHPAAIVRIDALPPAEADATLLREVFVNLISNAFKFTSAVDVASIEIGSRQEGGVVAYVVRDNGAGFDMQYAGKLFGVFQRFHSSETFAGIGIGLAICQRIVHRHGGTIQADAAVDRGATFSFTLGQPSL
jgi:light-regulated signal transduction histidine kinase (bacteriophytochrome)